MAPPLLKAPYCHNQSIPGVLVTRYCSSIRFPRTRMLDLHPMEQTPRSGGTGPVGTIQRILKRLTSLRLRTKFLLSLVLVTAGLTCVTLLVAQRHADLPSLATPAADSPKP